MCGIAGVYEYAVGNGTVDAGVLCAMRETLQHRGPDEHGLYVDEDRRLGFAHRRLSIVDLAHGAQPMRGPGGLVLVFNGEIYNYPDLRARLEAAGVAFDTHCDTEVILHLYHRYGTSSVDHMDGMFAFALWDPRRRHVFVARDRVGEKPLYWTTRNGRFIFASEIKAILAHPSVPRDVNRDAIPGYLTHLASTAPETLFAGIEKLAPGTCGICDEGGLRTWRYWAPPEQGEWANEILAAAAERVRDLLHRSAESRLLADVPIGVLLSGGLDSTTIFGLLADRARELSAFSVGFPEHPRNDERAEAARVAVHYGAPFHDVAVTEKDAVEFLPKLVHHQDEPIADPVCIPLHFVCALARQNGVKVVMAGEGADELFWGYPAYRRAMLAWRVLGPLLVLPGAARRAFVSILASRVPQSYARTLLDSFAAGRPLPMHVPTGIARLDRASVAPRFDHRIDAGWPTPARRFRSRLAQLGADTQAHEFGLRLPELLLMRIDRFSMASSVEARVPFLSPQLIEYVYPLDPRLKMRGPQQKIVMREAVRDLIPEFVLQRPKQGFGAPVNVWFERRLRPVMERLINEGHLASYFDLDVLRRRLGGEGRFALWPILNFALWHHYWIEDRPLGPLLESIN
jgi:asparagine synthase (glutamine-hydrolysing)